ncbi:MAG TPA: hypothetical protein VGO84_12175 [Burkholderiales bacterium]|nr:hypothetical protein [Burkholderiales bacterium]
MAACCAGVLVAAGAVAHAKLPPPTPEQAAKAAEDSEKAKQQLAQEQAALARVQDRVVGAYQSNLKSRGIAPPTPTPVEPTPQANLPKTVVEPPRNTGPRGGTTQSAESHSGQAK